MKRILIALMTATILAGPLASAHAAPPVHTQSGQNHFQKDHHGKRTVTKKVVRKDSRGHYTVRKEVKREHFARGQRVPDWQHRQVVRDHHRYGLQRPARGQQWVKVNNDYLLIGIASGIIAGVIAGR